MSTTRSVSSTRSASAAIFRTEVRLFTREPGSLFWIVAFPSLLLVILGLIPSFREPSADLAGQSVVDLYVPIAVLLAMIMASIQAMPTVLSTYREQGILRRLRVTPARPASLLIAQVGLHALAATASAVLVLAIGRLAFDTPLPEHVIGYLVAFVLAIVSALAIGAVITAVARTAKASATIGTVVFFPAMFTAGVWLPVQTMPDLLRRIVEATPLGAAADALNTAATGSMPAVVDLAVMLGWSAVLICLALRFFRWE